MRIPSKLAVLPIHKIENSVLSKFVHFLTFLLDREAIEEYATEMNKVTEEILGNLSLLMGMDKDGLKLLHAEMKQAMRLNYYPACSRPDLVLGISPHSDASSLTVLLQDNEITGLQIRHKGGWVPVNPIPNALVVNIGDAIEVFDDANQAHVEMNIV